jgi:hypothetical protein
MGCDKQDKNGEGTMFWKDIWMGKVPIKSSILDSLTSTGTRMFLFLSDVREGSGV